MVRAAAPDDYQVVQSFLRGDKDFLLFSPSAYNTVGLGTTQLYNRTLVYNRKRHGIFKLGNREFDFREIWMSCKPDTTHTQSRHQKTPLPNFWERGFGNHD